MTIDVAGLEVMPAHTIFKDYARLVHSKAIVEPVKFPTPLTPLDAQSIMVELWAQRDLPVLIAVLLCWCTAARMGCTLLLLHHNLELVNNTLRARFVEGKGVSARGSAYTVHSLLGPWAGQAIFFPRKIVQGS
jgi:hypothetical protein